MKPDWGKGYTRKATALARMGNERGALMTYQAGMDKCPQDQALRQAAMKMQNALNAKLTKQLFPDNYLDRLKANVVTKKYLEDPKYAQMLELIKQQPALLGQIAQMDPRVQVTIEVLSGVNVTVDPVQAANQAKEDAKPRVRQTRNHWAPKPKKKEEDKEKNDGDDKNDESNGEDAQKEDPEVVAKREKAEKFKEIGNKHYKAKEFEEAISSYEEAAKTLPESMKYVLNIAAAHLAMKDYEAVLKDCDRALNIASEHGASFEDKGKALGRKGKALVKMKRFDDAISAFDDSLMEFDDKNIEKALRKAKLAKKKADELAYLDPEKALVAKEEGNKLFRDGKFAESIKFYSEAIKRDPKTGTFYFNRAYAYTKLMDFDRAHSDCEKGLKLDPKNAKGYYRKGQIELLLKKYHQAMDSFRTGLKVKPGDKACTLGLQQVTQRVNAEANKGDQQERAKEAMKDPEIQAIMSDPVMRGVLSELSDPVKMRHHMANAEVRGKIEKLVAAGIIGGRMG